MMKGREVLIFLSLKYGGNWEKMIHAIKVRESFPPQEITKAAETVKCPVLTILDPQYPSCFRNCYEPPLVLYYYGNLGLLSDEKKCLAYIGSRDASPYGLSMANILVNGIIKKGYSVITGLARGIDGAATSAALESGGKAIVVLGSGIDVPYPSSNAAIYERVKQDGLVLSEYPSLTPPAKENFPKRNRLIAACAGGIVVGEATRHSGTLITVGYALGSNKEIGCVPYRANEESACNVLIKEGADMIENVSDILLMMGDSNAKKDKN